MFEEKVRVGRKMREVLRYIRDNPGSSIMEAARAVNPGRPIDGRFSVLACTQNQLLVDQSTDGSPRSLHITEAGLAEIAKDESADKSHTAI